MNQSFIVPALAAAAWCLVMYSGLSNGALFVRVFIVANLVGCIVFLIAAAFNIGRIRRS